jgi:hypothetical protein
MKNDKYIVSVEELIATTEFLARDSGEYILFRGQPNDDPLLPKIARNNPNVDTTALEVKMIKEFRRRLARERDIAAMDDWDILVYAQHHGLFTRLLDWTTNPLFALWFACLDYKSSSDGYIYFLSARDEALLDTAVEKDPFKIGKTYVVKPNVNNSRIRAQSGWFTVHRYSQKEQQFVDLDRNTSIEGHILIRGIPQNKKLDILKTLDKLGINEESVYPSPEGTAKHINWLHRDDL